MDSHSLLILIAICSSAGALVKKWSRTSDDGNTTCNYSFTYDVARKFEADEVISEVFICASTKTCIRTMNYEKTYRDQNPDDDEEIDENTVENLVGKVEKIGNNSIFIQNIRHVSGSVSCIINPGYKGQIAARTRFQQIVGTYEQRCLTLCDDCVENVYTVPVDIEEPIDNENYRFGADKIRCKIEPAANLDEEKILCNAGDKAVDGPLLEAIDKAVQKAVVNTPLMGSRTIENATVWGVNAWSLGICWNDLEQQACQACLSYLAVRITEKCSKSVGAQLYVNDCGLRYENYEIVPFNYEDSFPR